MGTSGEVRQCRCGTRIARDNRNSTCTACATAVRQYRPEPPRVPPDFWQELSMRRARASRDMGKVMPAFRTRPSHSVAISREVAAGWVGVTQSRLSKLEAGAQLNDLTKLMRWA